MPASSTLSPVSVDPCFFPRMVGHPNKGNGGYQTVTVSRPSQREITEFCVKRRVPMEHVVAAAWSLTLREYVGSETVAFAFRDRVNLAPQLVGAKMESSAWLTELVDSFKKDSPHNTTCEVYTQDLLPALHSNINTAVLWDDSKESGNGRSSVSDGLLDTSEYAVSVQIPHLELRYNRSHLEDLDADNVANALSQAIAKIVKSESPTTLRDVSLLGEEGMKQIKQWNANMPDLWPVRIEEIIYQLVLEQPNSPAVHAWDGHYTYAELDRAADGFANYLRKLGVKPGMIVPFCFPKSSWAVVAVLAILKAGGAAAALDPNYPSERLRQIMEQTGATIIRLMTAFSVRRTRQIWSLLGQGL
ncbi:hypothetical protein AbraCBS73388_007051 [Aspergillus brasiliensis]|uniref:AMP-dependent synthetase/ligase domain-containing protein n=1 Tax=Aspergillus brasiliensis TaxID=319629 RepID=A0A9W6DUH9_9EURO|nr:hypothetical protein AbraCBS73388_007051 [Aspergillus brasiliensis]